MLEDALFTHFSMIRDKSIKKADSTNLAITTMVAYHLRFLLKPSHEGDLEISPSYYSAWMDRIWHDYKQTTGKAIHLRWIMQA